MQWSEKTDDEWEAEHRKELKRQKVRVANGTICSVACTCLKCLHFEIRLSHVHSPGP